LDHLKDDFMSSVTHELRTPLTSIRAFSEILLDDPKINLKERMNFLGIIASETERLTRLVNQVLDLAKIESGHADWKSSEVDLAEVISQSVATTEQLILDKGGVVHLHLPNGASYVMADRDRLMQVMLNLLSNAEKFIPQGSGRIDVSLSREHNLYRVSIADNGPGIPPAAQAVIFDKFRQVGDKSANPLGTGLGLPISREIIEHFGGHISVHSSPGHGAIFIFELPCKNQTVSADNLEEIP
jgi:hypothetical protein